MDLQHDKEMKDAEAARLAEQEIIRVGLLEEIELLKKQRDQIARDNDQRLGDIKARMDDSIKRLSDELRALQTFCWGLRASNTDLEGK
jgi:hypothetical protein